MNGWMGAMKNPVISFLLIFKLCENNLYGIYNIRRHVTLINILGRVSWLHLNVKVYYLLKIECSF